MNLFTLVSICLLPIVCEAITEIIGASTLFKPMREFIIKKKIPFFAGLCECKYCLSVWVSAFVSIACWMALGTFAVTGANLLILCGLIFVVHRMSNILHLIFDSIMEYKMNRWIIDLT